MNKSVNLLTFLLIIPAMIIAVWVFYDMPIESLNTTGSQLPYKTQVFAVIAGMIGFLNIRRAIGRWTGFWVLSQKKRFTWHAKLALGRTNRAVFYLSIEAIVSFIFAFFFFYFTKAAWPLTLILTFMTLEFIASIIASKTGLFALGITPKAIVSADRESNVIYLNGLQKITTQQQTIFFDFPDEIQHTLSTAILSDADIKILKSKIEELVDRDRVYFSESFKNL